MNKYFSEWLADQLAERGMSQKELAQRSGLSASMVSLLLSGQRTPSANTCLYIARGLDLEPETVQMRAGLLPEKNAPDEDPTLGEIVDLMKGMSQEERQEILEYVIWRLKKWRGKD